MENKLALGTLFLCFHLSISYSSSSQLPIIGLHPLDEKYYDKEVIKCKDGSKTFIRDRLNDNFCDCPDGTDEPGTSACQTGKFYCRNIGSTPRFIFSSRVNDHICDCCDGSDEYDGITTCPNTCIMGGFVYQKVNYDSITNTHGSVNSRKAKLGTDMEDSGQKLGGLLKGLVVFQVALVIIVMAFRLFRRRKTRRRNPR